MELELHRKWRKKGYSIGILKVDGERVCESLEDEDRELTDKMPPIEIRTKKVYGQTAIPTGTYQVIWSFSPRFNKYLPLVQGVKGFEGIRIHSGNKAKDTEGCILLGKNTEVGMVTNSRYWTNKVNARIEATIKRGEKVYINIHW